MGKAAVARNAQTNPRMLNSLQLLPFKCRFHFHEHPDAQNCLTHAFLVDFCTILEPGGDRRPNMSWGDWMIDDGAFTTICSLPSMDGL